MRFNRHIKVYLINKILQYIYFILRMPVLNLFDVHCNGYLTVSISLKSTHLIHHCNSYGNVWVPLKFTPCIKTLHIHLMLPYSVCILSLGHSQFDLMAKELDCHCDCTSRCPLNPKRMLRECRIIKLFTSFCKKRTQWVHYASSCNLIRFLSCEKFPLINSFVLRNN